MKKAHIQVILLILLVNLLIIKNPTNLAVSRNNNVTEELDSDEDGINDLMEDYHQRNVSVTTTTSEFIVNSNWTRPSENTYNFKRYYYSLFPGKSGNAIQTVISTEKGLSVKYILSQMITWENHSRISYQLQMTVSILSLVEYRDINNNNGYDPEDERISYFETNSTGYNFTTSTEIMDNEEVIIVNVCSNDINSTLELDLLFSNRFYRLPDTDIIASPINEYAYLIARYPFTVDNSDLSIELSIDWPDGIEYCTRPITDLIWNSSISGSGFKTGYDSKIITELKYWYYSLLFSWNDGPNNNKMIIDQIKQNKINIETLHLSYGHSEMIKQGMHFGLLEYNEEVDFNNVESTTMVISVDMVILIVIMAIFFPIKRYRRRKRVN